MEIRYKTIIHERTEDAPFVGALISAIDCTNRCKGCFNKHLFKLTTKTSSGEDIITNIYENKFNKGIIFGGLEWSNQGMELLELCKLASAKKLEIMIYTGYSLSDFFIKLGKQIVTSTASTMYEKAPDEVFEMLGKISLDYFAPEVYYIKTGAYDKTKAVNDYSMFGVSLASRNQTIYCIRPTEESEEIENEY